MHSAACESQASTPENTLTQDRRILLDNRPNGEASVRELPPVGSDSLSLPDGRALPHNRWRALDSGMRGRGPGGAPTAFPRTPAGLNRGRQRVKRVRPMSETGPLSERRRR